MIFEYTHQEKAEFEKLRQKYIPRLNSLIEKETNAAEDEERTQLINEQSQIQLQYNYEIKTLIEKCEAEHFKQIATSPEAILKNAEEQIPAIIETNYHTLTKSFTPEDLITLGNAVKDNDNVLLKANIVKGWIMEELKLHLTALQGDKKNLTRLFELIIDGIENSNLTNREEIVAENTEHITRYRRKPLKDINLYGLMNDKANYQLIQQDGIFHQAANGQMQLLFDVDQTPIAVKKKATKSGQTIPAEKQIISYIALTYEGTEDKITKKLTRFDNEVYNAIATRFYYWTLETPQKPLYITPQEIWRTMNGKSSRDGKASPSKTQVMKICDSMDKMRFTHFYMDLREEVKAYNLFFNDERIEGGYIDSYLLNCSKVEFSTEKGRTLTGYRISEEPILYTYNRAKDHVLYVPYEMLDTSTNTSDSENVTEIKGYLLQVVQLMKNGATDHTNTRFKRSNRILLTDIYKKTGIKTPEERLSGREYNTDRTRQAYIRKQRKADREKIEGILTAWTGKGWITSYMPVKKGNVIIGYDISI